MPLVDSDALLHAGFGDGLHYLGSPMVVDAILRDALQRVSAMRVAQLKGGPQPAVGIRDLAVELQRIFYGQSHGVYQSSAWNSPEQLGRALVERCGIGGDVSDAAMRASVRMVKEFVSDLVAHEQDELTEEEMQAAVDALLSKYTRIFVGSSDASA